MKNTRVIIFMGLFIALQIILTRFLSIQTPIVRIGFSFIPLALSAIIFGPLIGGIGAAAADFIGMMLFPVGGTYFPGFTISAFLSAGIYGLLLYKKSKSITRISISVILVSLLIESILNTYWLRILTGKAFLAILPVRLTKILIMIPIQIILIKIIWEYIDNYIKSEVDNRRLL